MASKSDSLSEAERRAIEHGIDLSLLDENLRLTPRERMRRHDDALNFAKRLQMAQSGNGTLQIAGLKK